MEAIRGVSPTLFAGWSVCRFPYKLYSLPSLLLLRSSLCWFLPVCASSLPRPTVPPRRGVEKVWSFQRSFPWIAGLMNLKEPWRVVWSDHQRDIGGKMCFNQPWSGSVAGWLRGRGGKPGWEVSRWKAKREPFSSVDVSGENIKRPTPLQYRILPTRYIVEQRAASVQVAEIEGKSVCLGESWNPVLGKGF